MIDQIQSKFLRNNFFLFWMNNEKSWNQLTQVQSYELHTSFL